MIRAHNSMKVLVTGTTGWLGGELAKKLAEQGHSIVGLARRATKIEGVTSVQADLEDGASITVEGCAPGPHARDGQLRGVRVLRRRDRGGGLSGAR